jgi:hypothetical protein
MPRTERQQEAVEKALRERNKLYSLYRLARRQHRQTLYAEHPQGWRLKAFALQLARFKLPDGPAFLTYVQEENRSWLCTAPPDIRHEALTLIDERIMRIRQEHGLVPLDDPLPWGEEEDNIWQLCKQELA